MGTCVEVTIKKVGARYEQTVGGVSQIPGNVSDCLSAFDAVQTTNRPSDSSNQFNEYTFIKGIIQTIPVCLKMGRTGNDRRCVHCRTSLPYR